METKLVRPKMKPQIVKVFIGNARQPFILFHAAIKVNGKFAVLRI